MSFYQFSNKVQIISGKGSLNFLADRMTSLGARNILIISDHNIKRLGYVKQVQNVIASNTRLRVNAIYVNIKQGASTDNIEEAYCLYRDNSCDSIVAIGGDSVMNAAKVLNLMLVTKNRSISSIFGNNSAKEAERVPFGIVATTIGASRGIGKAAFIKDQETGERREIITDLMQPDFCILDPIFSESLREDKIALNVIEMLANCIEIYVGKTNNPIRKNYALYAIGMLRDCLNRLADIKEINEDLRFTLQEVGATAGMAISSSAGGMSLALANAIFDIVGANRNEMLAIVFPKFLRRYKNIKSDSYAEMLQYGFTREEFIAVDEKDRADVFVESAESLVKAILAKYNLPTNLSHLKLTEEQIDKIATTASFDSAVLESPIWLDKQDLVEVIKECM